MTNKVFKQKSAINYSLTSSSPAVIQHNLGVLLTLVAMATTLSMAHTNLLGSVTAHPIALAASAPSALSCLLSGDAI